MKKSTIKFLLLNPWAVFMTFALLCISGSAQSQNWILPFCSNGPPSSTTSSTYGPMYSVSNTNANNRSAYIIPSSQLSTISGTTLTSIYFHKATATSMLGTPNFKIYLKEVSAADWGSGSITWATEIASATLVYDGNPVSILGSTAGWKQFPLIGSGFSYSGTQNLAVMVEYLNTSSSNSISWSYDYTSACVNTSNSYTTKYNNNTSGTLSATLASTNYRRPYMAFDYVLPPCVASSFPSSATTNASPNNICVSGSSSLTITPSATMPGGSGITYQWQTSPTIGGTYTNIGTASSTMPYTATVNTTSYYRCQVYCGTTLVITSAPTVVTVQNPGVPTVNGASRCGPGSVTLTATPPSGSTINWYATNTGGNVLGTGNSFTTPYLPTTTTFYAGAAAGTSTATPQIGTGTLTAPTGTNGGPFNNYYRNQTSQFLYTAAEIMAAGGGAGSINSIAFNCLGIPVQTAGNTTLPNYKVYIKTVPNTMTTLTWQAASTFTQVYTNAAFNPALGWNTFTLSAPFPYNGVDNIVISFCYEQTQPSYSAYATSGLHEYTNVTGRMLSYYNDGVSTACGETGTASFDYLPNVRLGMTLGCVGTLQPVVATINAGPALNVSNPAVICSNEIGTIAATSSPMTNYTNYQWTPNVTDLYINSSATTPYSSGSAPTVYVKSSVAGPRTYYLFASGATAAACTHADTISVWVQPDEVHITAIQDTLCAPSGSTTLKLVPNTGYAPNSIQWLTSSDGINYSIISGANGVSYTTPSISSNTYYKAMIKATLDTCQQPVKLIVVSDPQLTSANDSFNCGPGTVTLTATTAGNSSVRWYSSASANTPIGSGSPWTTPYLTTTTAFYADAGNGTIQPGPTFVGNGTNADWWGYLPYFGYYYANKAQWLVTAAELTAAGFGPGLITKIGFDVTSGSSGAAVKNVSYSMKLIPGTLSGFESGMQTVWSAATYSPVLNSTNVHTLQTPFFWDGVSNLVIEECNTNTTATYLYTSVKYNNTLSNGCVYYYVTSSGPASTNCSAPTGYYTTSTRPNIQFTMLGGCSSPRQMVTASIYPKPAVDLGPDINKCVDANEVIVLDAGVQPNGPQFLWDNGSTSQVRAVNASGQYFARVTNSYTCANTDTINIIMRQNPVVELGNDTIVCNGVTLTLDPGSDGTQYFWNTGQTTQTIGVTSSGTYNVFVTNDVACTAADTINVTMQGELPTIAGIQISNNGQFQFHFTAVYPQNVIGYDWDFGDGTPHSYQASPTHTYADGGNYVVVLRLSSTCGFLDDTTSAHIVGINQITVGADELMVYPNPSQGAATILNKSDLKMESIQIYNVLGQVVYRAKADSDNKHQINVGELASGVYTIEINTDKGTVARKLNILK